MQITITTAEPPKVIITCANPEIIDVVNPTRPQVVVAVVRDGKDGIDGIDGVDGVDGYTPVKGVDYFDGDDGYTPIKGVDYFDGEKGEDYNFREKLILLETFTTASLTGSNYSAIAVNTGSVQSAVLLSDVSENGGLVINSNSNASGGGSVALGNSNAPGTFRFGTGKYVEESKIYIPALSTPAQRFFDYFGFSSSSNNLNSFGAFLLYDEGAAWSFGVGNTASINWKAITVDGVGRTQTISNIEVLPATWYTLKIEVNEAGNEIKFFVNNVLFATHTTNIYTAAGLHLRLTHQKTIGTLPRTLEARFMKHELIYKNAL